jgi:hypothetical protein
MEITKETYLITPLNTTELHQIYNVSYKTFIIWLKPIKEKVGKRKGYYYSIEQLKIIFEHLGFPEKIKET